MESCLALCICKGQPRKMPKIEHTSQIKFNDGWILDAGCWMLRQGGDPSNVG